MLFHAIYVRFNPLDYSSYFWYSTLLTLQLFIPIK